MSEFWQFSLIGLSGGCAYALMALGIVAVYRGSGILNFAQGGIGMVAAYVFWELSDQGQGSLPVLPALLIAMLATTALSVLFYVIVVRHLRNASEMAKVVVTLGLMLLLESLALVKYGSTINLLPPLFGEGTITIFGGTLTDNTLVLLGVTLVVAVGLWALFNRTRFGMRAAALRQDPVAAAAIGISPHPTGVVTWGVGGAIAAISGITLTSITGLSADALTLLVIPAMAAGLVGRFSGIASTVVVGLALGIAEAVLGGQFEVNSGVVASLPFAVIIVAVVLGGRALLGRGESLTVRLPRVGSGRIKPVKGAILFAVAIAMALLLSSTWQTAMVNTCIFGLIALSIVVVTGYAGQLSVASAAFAGFGAFVAAHASDGDLSFLVCVVCGTLAAVVLGVIFGAPAVRVRGVNLVIVTLGLSSAVEDMVFNEPGLTGSISGLPIHTPTVLGLSINPAGHPGRYAVVCVVALALGSLAVLNVRRGVSGRRYVSMRANERGAASMGISVPGAKLGAFAVSAGLAGLAGSLAVFQLSVADFSGYDVFDSITNLAITALLGVGFVAGALAAAVSAPAGLIATVITTWVQWTSVNLWLPIISAVAVIDVMVRFPDGAILNFELLGRFVGRQLSRARAGGAHAPKAGRSETPPQDMPAQEVALVRQSRVSAGETVLAADAIRVTYGGVCAVDDVSLKLVAGEVVGVIGPNGAGKTSLIDGLTGFAAMESGTIELLGEDLTRSSVHARARRGIGRTFQNLELFDDLSVRENIQTALDGRSRLAYATDLVWPTRSALSTQALTAVSMLGLDAHLDTIVADLPQGLRRMVAVARVVAQEPVAIIMDEPAAGLSGAERRTAAKLFRALSQELGAAVLLVEHNIDVVSACCDHLIVLNFGRVIAAGATADVLRDPAVREAYLGRSATDTPEVVEDAAQVKEEA